MPRRCSLVKLPLEIFQRVVCYALEIDPDRLPSTPDRQNNQPGPRDLHITSSGGIAKKLSLLQQAYPRTIDDIAGRTAILNRITCDSFAGLAAFLSKPASGSIIQHFDMILFRWNYSEIQMQSYDAIRSIVNHLPTHITSIYIDIPCRSHEDLEMLHQVLSPTLREVKLQFTVRQNRSDATRKLLEKMRKQAKRKRDSSTDKDEEWEAEDRKYSASLRQKEFESRRASLRSTTTVQRKYTPSRWSMQRIPVLGREQ